jgi:hypothetical protein
MPDSLAFLAAFGNQLSGELPLINSTTIRGVSLGSNAISGTLPPAYQSAPRLAFLDLSSNQLAGPLAASIHSAGPTPPVGPWGADMPSLRCG